MRMRIAAEAPLACWNISIVTVKLYFFVGPGQWQKKTVAPTMAPDYK